MTHIFRRPTAFVRSCASFPGNHPDYKTWGDAGFDTFCFKANDRLLDTGLKSIDEAGKGAVISVDYQGESASDFTHHALSVRNVEQLPICLELEWSGGIMPFGMQAEVFTALRKAWGPELKAPLGVFAPPLKDSIDYGAIVDNGGFILLECYGKSNDVVVPPKRCVGRVMTWYNEAAGRMQGVGARRIIPIVSAGQAGYFVNQLAGTGTRGLWYWTCDDDQGAVDAAKYKPLFGAQPPVEPIAWTVA
jgi:hypothetical protein